MNMSPSGGMSQLLLHPISTKINDKKNIQMYIHQEKIRLTSEANAVGIKDSEIERYFTLNKVKDFYLENLKVNMGIIEKKPERPPRKTN